MALTASTKNAIRISLGQQAGSEVINAIEGFAATLKELSAPAQPAPDAPDPVTQPSAQAPAPAKPSFLAPAAPVVPVPPAEEDTSHLDGPAS